MLELIPYDLLLLCKQRQIAAETTYSYTYQQTQLDGVPQSAFMALNNLWLRNLLLYLLGDEGIKGI